MSKKIERREEVALAMYSGGATYAEIASQLQMSVAGARSLVMRSMRNAFSPAEDLDEWRKAKVAELEVLQNRLWPQAEDPKVAAQIIRAIDKQADLMGVARLINTTQTTNITIEHIEAYREQLQQRLDVVKGELIGTPTDQPSHPTTLPRAAG